MFRTLISIASLALVGACSPGEKSTEARPPNSSDSERGRLLLAQYQCGSCHSIPGVASAQGKVSSSLQGFGRRSYIAGRFSNQPDTLVKWIVDPQALAPGTAMPSMGVTVRDARDMSAYLTGLR